VGIIVGIKVYLDDDRPTPPGWVGVLWPDEAIALLQTETVDELSLDHDLGDDDRGVGYDVLTWMEQAVVEQGFRPPKRIVVHSANASVYPKMSQAIRSIHRLAERFSS
jgi:hypothetical protein